MNKRCSTCGGCKNKNRVARKNTEGGAPGAGGPLAGGYGCNIKRVWTGQQNNNDCAK